jgi:hypothetical protein
MPPKYAAHMENYFYPRTNADHASYESQRDSASKPGVETTPGMTSTDFHNPERVVEIPGDT